MPSYKIKWSNLLFLTELDFIPERPAQLTITDEIVQSISWLTGATGHDRKLLRCSDDGILLTDNAWANLIEVETGGLFAVDSLPETFTASVPNKGVLVATSTKTVKVTFVRFSGGDDEVVYLPPSWLYWFGHPVYTVKVEYIAAPGGETSHVGISVFN